MHASFFVWAVQHASAANTAEMDTATVLLLHCCTQHSEHLLGLAVVAVAIANCCWRCLVSTFNCLATHLQLLRCYLAVQIRLLLLTSLTKAEPLFPNHLQGANRAAAT